MKAMNEERELEALLAFVTVEARVCPRPVEWHAFWKSSPNVRTTTGGWESPAPLILAGWWDSSNEEKAQRLELRVRWAAAQGALVAADAFLRGLPIAAWHHSDPTKPNY